MQWGVESAIKIFVMVDNLSVRISSGLSPSSEFASPLGDCPFIEAGTGDN